MSSILILSIVIVLINGAWMYFFFANREKDDKKQKDLFREFVIASKSRTLEQYVEAIPGDDEPAAEPPDVLEDLYNVDPSDLLNAIKKQDESQ